MESSRGKCLGATLEALFTSDAIRVLSRQDSLTGAKANLHHMMCHAAPSHR